MGEERGQEKTEQPNDGITRRGFIKLLAVSGAALLSSPFERIVNIPEAPPSLSWPEFENKRRKSLAIKQAASWAKDQFGGQPYKYGKRDCGMYAAKVAEYLGIPVVRDTTSVSAYEPGKNTFFPHATTVKQVKWFKVQNESLGKELITEPKMNEIIQPSFWQNVEPGSFCYLRTPGEGPHGYNEYSHVAIFVGFENGNPLFAEYSVGMEKGPQTDRSLQKLLEMYPNVQEIPPDLTTTIINVPRLVQLKWKRGGKVVPNLSFLEKSEAPFYLLTVNIHSGETAFWEKPGKGETVRRSFTNRRMTLYSVTGRLLIPRTELTEKYDTFRQREYQKGEKGSPLNYSAYVMTDMGACFYGTPLRVPRFYLTPPLVFELKGFGRVSNFGNLGGYTDIAYLHILYFDSSGKLITDERRSDYTIHATPQKTKSQQELLLRDETLNSAHNVGQAPLPETIHLTSGCVNFTPEVFEIIRNTLQKKAEDPGKVLVVFSYPDFPQDLQLDNRGFSLATDPLGALASKWDYGEP